MAHALARKANTRSSKKQQKRAKQLATVSALVPEQPIPPLTSEEVREEARKVDLVQRVAERMTLTVLSAGAWQATRLHREETDDVNKRHGTVDRANVRVRQCTHPALKEIYNLQAQARVKHKMLTMPTVQDGIRMLPRKNMFKHSDVLKEFDDKIATHLDELCVDYLAEKVKQKQQLNGLYDERAWPATIEALRHEFYFRNRYLPCPTDGQWSEWLAESAEVVDREVMERFQKALSHMAERCSSDGKLYETVFGNLRELLDLVPDFDLEGKYGPIVEAAREVAKYDAEEVREDKKTRKQIAKRANEIAEMFSGLAKK